MARQRSKKHDEKKQTEGVAVLGRSFLRLITLGGQGMF